MTAMTFSFLIGEKGFQKGYSERNLQKTMHAFFVKPASHQKTKATANILIITHKLKQICIVLSVL